MVTFKAEVMPIAGFPHTGDFLGAGAAVQTEYKIDGTEYGGFPPVLMAINLYLPSGLLLHPAGFPTCPVSTLEPIGPGPKACPEGSQAGPVGRFADEVPFGSKIVPEGGTIESFYAPGGGLEFFTFGHEPAIMEAISTAHYISAGGLYSNELISEIPPVETVPGAQYASTHELSMTIGSAYENAGEVTYYARLPSACPSGGLPFTAEIYFAAFGGLGPQEVTETYTAPCPVVDPEQPPPTPTPKPGTGGVVTAPSHIPCVSGRDFVVHVPQIKQLRYRRVRAAINGHAIAVVTGSRSHVRVDLKGRPKGAYTLRITATTTTGRRISWTRTYHTCL